VKGVVLNTPLLSVQTLQLMPLSVNRFETGTTVLGRVSLSVSPTTGVAAGLLTRMWYVNA
jgi:hypothetical protein